MEPKIVYFNQSDLEEELKSRPYLKYDGKHLIYELDFKGYLEGLKFVVLAGTFAEEIDHHPDEITIFYKKVRIKITTHSHSAITDLDFIFMEKAKSIYESSN